MTYENIRPYHDNEVNEALNRLIKDPMMMALFDYAFPEKDIAFYKEKIATVHSTYDFHKYIIYPALKRVLDETAEELSTSGFDKLKKDEAYLYISNHRDIVLDTTLTNLVLLLNDMRMTASAIGDNLVPTDFLLGFAKVNRNFLVHRSLPPREMLAKSKELSSYIRHLMEKRNSIWLAQKEGRTKDGNDNTHPGVLKMLSMAKPKDVHLCDYFISLNIVPLSISYEYDPTDYMKMPAILAGLNGIKYQKTKNEDFNNILKGVLGYKKNIHLSCGLTMDEYLLKLKSENLSDNATIKTFAQKITEEIQKNYVLHETNYIAYDLLHESSVYKEKYSEEALEHFKKRMETSIDVNDKVLFKNFLLMYANPVVNKFKLMDYA
jgi:hypothetical protein